MTTLYPSLRLRALAQGTTLPDRTIGSALFADISGFTVLTENLWATLGPRCGAPLYGREREKLELQRLLTTERIVLLYSPSGAGKTSLIQAGLLPELEKKFTVLPTIRVNATPEKVWPH